MSGYYGPDSEPKPVRNGIRLKSRRGAIGTAWWTKAVQKGILFEAIGSRDSKGKKYARSGQIMDFSVRTGEVLAIVQGSYQNPYRVRIAFPQCEENQEHLPALYDYLADHPSFLLHLGSGGLTPDMTNDLKHRTHFQLLPPEWIDSKDISCTCPDYSFVCKHILAVLYLLSERLDEDPMLLFPLAGVGIKTLYREQDRRRRECIKDGKSEAPAEKTPRTGYEESEESEDYDEHGKPTGPDPGTISAESTENTESMKRTETGPVDNWKGSFWKMKPALKAAGLFTPAEDPESLEQISSAFYEELARNDLFYEGTFTFSTNLAGFREKAMKRAAMILKVAEKTEAKRKEKKGEPEGTKGLIRDKSGEERDSEIRK